MGQYFRVKLSGSTFLRKNFKSKLHILNFRISFGFRVQQGQNITKIFISRGGWKGLILLPTNRCGFAVNFILLQHFTDQNSTPRLQDSVKSIAAINTFKEHNISCEPQSFHPNGL